MLLFLFINLYLTCTFLVSPHELLKVEESKYKDLYQKRISLHYGNFYIFDEYVISEISEGVHFNWDFAYQVIEMVYDHFGTRDIRVGYISNRINNYTVQAQDWLNFYKERHHLEAFAVVAYNKKGFMNVILEKVFTHTRLKKFSDLDTAVDWIVNLNPAKPHNE